MFTNQSEIYETLQELISPLSATKVISISGKCGIGKTYVIETLISNVQKEYSCPICYIKGDQFLKTRDYYCMHQAISQLANEYEKKNTKKDTLLKGTEGIPYFGPFFTQLLSNKLRQKEILLKQKSHFLSDEELDIVYRLNYIFDKRSSLIVCDDLQYFDNKSLELLYLMLSNSEDLFGFFDKCQFLLIHTDTGETLHPLIQNILTEKAQRKLEMPTVKYDDMDKILHDFGCDVSMDEKIKKVLFQLSEGHLEIIKQIAIHLVTSKEQIEKNYKSNNIDIFLEDLVTRKLRQLGANGEQISTLLEYASLIGKSFSHAELSYILDLNKQDFYDAIKKSNEIALISSKEKYSDFSHNIVHLLFRKRADKNLIFYNEKLKKCVKILTPSDYAQRIDIERNLGNFREAAILIVQRCIQNDYNDEFEDSCYKQILSMYPDINTFLCDICIAYRKYGNKNYEQTLLILNSIDEFLPIQLLAERDLLKSITLTKMLNDKYRKEAVSCLENYTIEKLDGEGDLFLRIQLSLIAAYTHMSQIDAAKKCEEKVYRYLQSRLDYDEKAYSIMNMLRRKANAIHECCYAERYIKKSVEYFSPLPNQCAPLNPIQYMMSLSNHAGILIECGRFKESYDESLKARALVNDNERICYPRPHIIDNNYLLALYLLNSSAKKDVMIAYKELVKTSFGADSVFILSNYCALLAVNGFPSKAYEMLKQLSKQGINSKEALYEICIDNNLLVLKLYYKEYADAQVILTRLLSHIPNIIDESYYQKKYELFQYVINNKIDIPIEKIDSFLFELCESYQEAWAYWGHSFDYTALYYWSDM